MKRISLIRTACVGIAGLSAAFLCSCSSGGDVAGGSGAGNPGSMVALTMLADTNVEGAGLQKALAAPVPRTLPLADANGLMFTLESAQVIVERIEFVFTAPGVVPCTDPFWDKHPEVICTGGAAAIDGPFLFDAMAGTVEPSLEDMILPATDYAHIKLWVVSRDASRSDPAPAVELTGSFDFEGETRSFALKLDINSHLMVRNKQLSSLQLLPEEFSDLEVTLDAALWLEGVGLNDNLSGRLIELEQNGSLIIDGRTATGAAKVIENQIVLNVLDSAVLTVGN